jgi:transcription-repair coupling factor (superfamily II helicase)
MQSNAQQVKMKEKQTRNGLRLLLNIDKVKSVGQVLAVLEKFSA